MRIAIAQINPTIGAIEENTARILQRVDAAKSAGAALVVFPELAIFGYPAKDLFLRQDLVDRNLAALEEIASRSVGIAVVVGFVDRDTTGEGKGIFNGAALCSGGAVLGRYAKRLLPTYDVFNECRYFNPGKSDCVVPLTIGDETRQVGLTICEDLWNNHQFEGRRVYGFDPIERTVAAGADLLINIAASPYGVGKQVLREALFIEQVKRAGVPLIYVNQVGGNDDLIFDGAGLVIDASGIVVARTRAFAEDLLVVDLATPAERDVAAYPQRVEAIRQALVLGIRDYLAKCGFQKVVIGVSGGIDSALTAALAVEAVGGPSVRGVAMPSRFSSTHSLSDARLLATNLGIELEVIPIEEVHGATESVLKPIFGDRPADVTEENIQARIRGNLLMAISNKFGWLLLTTGNKSELAVGYCTLYGDMCGGLAVLSDVPKTLVFELSRHINQTAGRSLIPDNVITKPPSAELREDQFDQQTLPPYDTLDAILELLVEQERSIDAVVKSGFDRDTVITICKMLERSEYKRKQMPVGLKVTSRAFGSGRLMPIAARFR